LLEPRGFGASSATVFFRTIARATLAVALAAAIELFLILLLPCVTAPVLAAAAGELLLILVTSLGVAWLAADARFLARLVFGIPVHRRITQRLVIRVESSTVGSGKKFLPVAGAEAGLRMRPAAQHGRRRPAYAEEIEIAI
jgi:hypothetical protein